jgi:hypothetical protein
MEVVGPEDTAILTFWDFTGFRLQANWLSLITELEKQLFNN